MTMQESGEAARNLREASLPRSVRESSPRILQTRWCTLQPVRYRGCMRRRFIIKNTWLSAFCYAESRISLVFCRSIGFLVPFVFLADFVCYVSRRRWGGGGGGGLCLFVCKNYIALSLIYLNIFCFCGSFLPSESGSANTDSN
jgi:hypothetical protein